MNARTHARMNECMHMRDLPAPLRLRGQVLIIYSAARSTPRSGGKEQVRAAPILWQMGDLVQHTAPCLPAAMHECRRPSRPSWAA